MLDPQLTADDRIVRCDARWQGQKGRLTAIRNSLFKLIYDHDSDEFTLYSIKSNGSHSIETRINSEQFPIEFENLKNFFYETETHAKTLQIDLLLSRNSKKYGNNFNKHNIINKLTGENRFILEKKLKTKPFNQFDGEKPIFVTEFWEDLHFFEKFKANIALSGMFKDKTKFLAKLKRDVFEVYNSITHSYPFFREELH